MRDFFKFTLICLILAEANLGLAATTQKKSTSKSNSRPTQKTSHYLPLMFDTWAINPHHVNGPGYLKAANDVKKEEYEALKKYFSTVATQSAKDLKTVQEIAEDTQNIHSFFDALEPHLKSPADIDRWKLNLKKLHEKLLEVMKSRIGEDPTYTQFMQEEQLRELGDYSKAHSGRSTLDSIVTTINDKNEDQPEQLWSVTQKNPHVEMLIRMRQGTEILFANLLALEKQRFQIPELKIKSTKPDLAKGLDGDVDLSTVIRNHGDKEEGPNPILPPPLKE